MNSCMRDIYVNMYLYIYVHIYYIHGYIDKVVFGRTGSNSNIKSKIFHAVMYSRLSTFNILQNSND